MILSTNEIESYREGRFVIDIPHGLLRQRATPEHPDIVEGPASLRQSADGSLELTLYAISTQRKPRERRYGQIRVGSYLEEDEFFDFEGMDIQGRVWTAEWLHVSSEGYVGMMRLSTQGHLPGQTVICRANVREARCSRSVSRNLPTFVWLWLPGVNRIPVNTYTTTRRTVGDQTTEGFELNVWQFCVGDRSLLVSRHERGIELEVSSATPLPDAFRIRLQEALWLVLARRVEPSLVIRQQGSNLTASLIPLRSPVGQSRVQPPLNLTDPQYAAASSELVSAYLSATDSFEGGETLYHPLGVAISRILRASEVDIEMEALVLTTVVEGLANEYFRTLGKPDQDVSEVAEDSLRLIMDNIPPGEPRSRVASAIGALKGQNGRSALKKLSELGAITPAQLKSWNRIRHPIAHGAQRIDPPRDFGHHCNAVHAAFYRLVFQVIGYTGPYRDFETLGWPHIEYAPFALAAVTSVS